MNDITAAVQQTLTHVLPNDIAAIYPAGSTADGTASMRVSDAGYVCILCSNPPSGVWTTLAAALMDLSLSIRMPGRGLRILFLVGAQHLYLFTTGEGLVPARSDGWEMTMIASACRDRLDEGILRDAVLEECGRTYNTLYGTVLSMCRAWALLSGNDIKSLYHAAEYCLYRVPKKYSALVRAAQLAYKKGMDLPGFMRSQVSEFQRYMMQEVSAW